MNVYNFECNLAKTRSLSLCEKCPNTGKYGAEETPYLDAFHAVFVLLTLYTPKSQNGQTHSNNSTNCLSVFDHFVWDWRFKEKICCQIMSRQQFCFSLQAKL